MPWETSDTVEEHTIARTLFWNSADATGNNCSVWRAHHCYLRFIFDPEEDLLALTWIFSWTSPGRTPFLTKGLSRTTVGSATACHSIGSTVRSADCLSCKSVKHAISQLSHRAILVRSTPTCELSLDLLSYAGLAFCIALTSASLKFFSNSAAQRNN